MEALKWNEDKRHEDTFYKIKKVNNTYYKLGITVYFYNNSIKVNIGASSGTKRKHLDNFEVNDYPRDGGLKALMWIKEEIDKIPNFIVDYYILGKRNIHLCIGWEDSQRRDVYSRLERYGFEFMIDEGQKILMKRYIQTGA